MRTLSNSLAVLLLALLAVHSSAFAPRVTDPTIRSLSQQQQQLSPLTLYNQPKKKPYDEKLRKKLLSESIAPWRTIRLFLYGSLGSGAAVGGFIQLTGLLAALSKGQTDIDMNTEYLNLGIDFGAVALFAFLFKWDIDKQGELSEKVEQKLELKKLQKEVSKGMREREQLLGTLQLQVQISANGDVRQASVRELQAGARQHVILVAGPKKACKDALVGANLLKMDFAMSNVLVVPYETDVDVAELQSRPDGSGFGGDSTLPIYERQPYVARPTGDGWDEYVAAEMADAVQQNGEKAREEGIAVVVASNGKVVRRGVGKVPWRQMVEELDESVKPK
ncbi:hypothetical protein FisN_6Hh087 [Fistulifera solaris]|uniref:Uncharacterized protein n=1 Tax=Fistulifera solaris TaxID=1519565 RepID=A0A1Z5KIB7_FISSO|nr:hypothetical protein FisN_6Hh087 [Fistulifera solaris]|eukprot:GAX25875.1 hypothetical protein FisN_6Hh087 [Fistulifera solaris]